MAITLSACVSIPLPTGGSAKTTAARVLVEGTGAALLVKQARAALTRVRDEIAVHRGQLHPVPCESERCYSTDAVQAAIARIRKDVQGAFPDQALASRISLDEEIVEVSKLAAARPRQSIQLVRNGADGAPSTVTGRVVDAVFQSIQQKIDHYVAYGELNPTIHVTSDPDRATFWMQVGDNAATKRDARTNDQVQSVWRGHYQGHVSKGGYRDADFPIDLMNDDRTKVSCKLAAVSASEESICRLEK